MPLPDVLAPPEAAPEAAPDLAAPPPPSEIAPAEDLTPAQVVDASADLATIAPTAAKFTPIDLPIAAVPRLPSSTADVRAYVRQSAQQRGIDPDTAVRVVLSEGGLTPATWVGDHGSSFGPFQLHYGGVAGGGNAVGGLGDAFTAETHLDARDPRTWRQQVDWALNRAGRDGWTAWHGAASANIGPREGIGIVRGPTQAVPTYATTMVSATARLHISVPNQFASNLSPQEAYAACGPAAAVGLARYLGRNPTVAEALQLAKQNGWTLDGGMNGINNEKRLLDAMHINTQTETPLNWRHVQLDAARGTPVIISTPNHYWVIDDYDPTTGEYHVGQSGLVYANGAEWMTADRIQQLGGGLNGGLYIDNPLVAPAPRIVDAGWAAPSVAQSPARGSALDPGWSIAGMPATPPVDSAVHAANAAVAVAEPESTPVQVLQASAPVSERWWEDSRLVRADTAQAPNAGPEWV
jgi:hypothetical protein